MVIWRLLNNWKSVLGYLLVSVPGINDYPMLVSAVREVVANPSRHNIIALIGQLVLVTGILHRIQKNLRK